LTGANPDTFTRLEAKRREQTPQALARLVLASLFVGLWGILWLARMPMPVPFLIALLAEIAFFVAFWRVVFILPNVRSVSTAQYVMLAAEIVFHTTMVYFLGGLAWLAAFAYVFGLIFTNAFLDLRKGLIYTTGACAAFAALVLLEATSTIPHREYLPEGPARYTDGRLVFTTLLCATGVFYSIYLWSSWVGQQLRRERDAAIHAQDELLDARVRLQRSNEELEQRVRARTVDLEMANAALRDSEARLRTVITNAPIALFALDKNGAFTLLEGKAIEQMNIDPQQVIGRSAYDVYASGTKVIEAIDSAFAGERSTTLAPAGAVLFEAQLEPMRDDRGNIVGVIGVATDITERKRAENALRESEQRLLSVITNAPVALFALDKHGTFTLLEGKALEALNVEAAPLVGRSAFDVYARAPAVIDSINRAFAGERNTIIEAAEHVVFEAQLEPMRDRGGNITGVIGVATDITERTRAEQAIREREATLKATIESTADGILVVTNAGGVVYANQKFADMWNIPPKLLELRDDQKLLDYVLSQLQEPDAFLSKVKELYESDREDLHTLDFKDGSAFERYSRPLMLDDQVAGRVWSFRNVTEQKRAQRELAEQARRDPLTGLLNRRAGLEAIDQRLVAAANVSGRLAIFVLDLDKFKLINDSHSHEMGDAALIRLSDVLTDLFQDRGIVCRLGGDEFEIAIENIRANDAFDVAQQLRAALRQSLTNQALDRLPLFTASIGVACYPEDGDTAVELGRRADAAMYAGKSAGGDTVRAWSALKRERAA